MFWKKKKPPFSILNPGETAEKRQSFRYTFREGHGLSMTFSGTKVRLLDLSAGGMSFENHDFSVGVQDMVSLDLEIPCMEFHERICASMTIARIDENGICYACFENPDQNTTELIHRFILEIQKADLRSSRKDGKP